MYQPGVVEKKKYFMEKIDLFEVCVVNFGFFKNSPNWELVLYHSEIVRASGFQKCKTR